MRRKDEDSGRRRIPRIGSRSGRRGRPADRAIGRRGRGRGRGRTSPRPEGLGGLLRQVVRDEAREVRRRLTRPWRTGRPGTAAEVGRWIGLGLAVGATVLGVAAALYSARKR